MQAQCQYKIFNKKQQIIELGLVKKALNRIQNADAAKPYLLKLKLI